MDTIEHSSLMLVNQNSKVLASMITILFKTKKTSRKDALVFLFF